MAVDCLHHHLVLAELAQSPEAEMESCFVPVKTIKIKEMEWSLQAGMGCSLMKLFRLTLRLLQNIFRILPEVFVSNIVSDDTSMADFTIRFIPHHIQLGGGQCTHTNVLRGPFRPLTVRYELENIKYNLQEEDRKQNSEQAAQQQQQESEIVKVLTENIFHSFRDTTFLQDVH